MPVMWNKKGSSDRTESRVLIGTLYSGENEFEECCASLESQKFQNFDHLVISGLGKKEAHDLLYNTFMEHSDSYDYFFKLDADMVLSSPEALANLVSYICVDKAIDKLTVSVFDFFTNAPIIGAHIFSDRVRWVIEEEPLFTDSIEEVYPGIRKKIVEQANPNILHACNPTEFQAFVFGAHRAMKAVQLGRSRMSIYQVIFQFSVLKKVFIANQLIKDDRHYWALCGANFIIDGCDDEHQFLVHKKDLESAFKNFSKDRQSVISWSSQLFGPFGLYHQVAVLGWYRFLTSCCLDATSRLKKALNNRMGSSS